MIEVKVVDDVVDDCGWDGKDKTKLILFSRASINCGSTTRLLTFLDISRSVRILFWKEKEKKKVIK